VPPFVQRGHGIGNILGSLWCFAILLLWSGAKSLGKETLKTGSQILSDIANKPADVKARDIVTEHVTAKAKNLVKKLCGEGSRKRKRINRGGGPHLKNKRTKSST
jgi:hypothetical protein